MHHLQGFSSIGLVSMVHLLSAPCEDRNRAPESLVPIVLIESVRRWRYIRNVAVLVICAAATKITAGKIGSGVDRLLYESIHRIHYFIVTPRGLAKFFRGPLWLPRSW